DVLHLKILERVITDPHFIARDRMGRLTAFMARQVKDGFASPDILGVGVDDGAALVVGRDGVGAVLTASAGPAAYVVRGGAPLVAASARPLVYERLHLVKLASSEHTYDFARRCGRGLVREFDVDGNVTPPYPASPNGVYDDGTLANECP